MASWTMSPDSGKQNHTVTVLVTFLIMHPKGTHKLMI